MKNLVLVLSLLSLVACGKKTVTKNIYVENPFDNSSNDTRLSDIESKLSQLQSDVDAKLVLIQELRSDLDTSEANQAARVALQAEVNQLTAEILAIQSSKQVEMLTLCPTAKEVLFKVGNDVVAYFESGSNRYMSVLVENVNYQTSDGTACHFKIVNKQVVFN